MKKIKNQKSKEDQIANFQHLKTYDDHKIEQEDLNLKSYSIGSNETENSKKIKE